MTPLAQHWAGFLSRWNWTWFATLTFRGDPHPETADKRFRLWISKINRKLYGTRWWKHGRGVYWARASELQARGAIHYHALLGGDRLADAHRLRWMDEWNEIAGFARIEAPECTRAVLSYCSKYVSKEGQIDLGGPIGKPTQLGMFPAPPFRSAMHRK